jgi:hypothetical protein
MEDALTIRYPSDFQKLDNAATMYWQSSRQADEFRSLLLSSSSHTLNSFDLSGWTILTYVLWTLHGASEELSTLRVLLGPEVVKEDHSGLRLDKSILILLCDGQYTCTAKEILEFNMCLKHKATKICEKHLQEANDLLQLATERVASYPRRLITALKDNCLNYLPVQPLHIIIAGYLRY